MGRAVLALSEARLASFPGSRTVRHAAPAPGCGTIRMQDTGSTATIERFDEGESSLNSRGRVPVMLPYPFQGPFDYRIPPDLDPQPGDLVVVPLNRREEIGVVWDAPANQGVPEGKLKPLIAILDTPPMLG